MQIPEELPIDALIFRVFVDDFTRKRVITSDWNHAVGWNLWRADTFPKLQILGKVGVIVADAAEYTRGELQPTEHATIWWSRGGKWIHP